MPPVFLNDVGTVRKEQRYGEGLPYIHYVLQAHGAKKSEKFVARIIERLLEQTGAPLVCVESAWGILDGRMMKTLLDSLVKQVGEDKRATMATTWLDSGKMTGAEFHKIMGKHSFELYGADDQDQHTKMIAASAQLQADGPRWGEEVARLRTVLWERMAPKLSPELRSLCDVIRAAHDKAEFQQLTKTIFEYADRRGVDLSPLRNLQKLRETIELETTIDFERAQVEQQQIQELIQREVFNPQALIQRSLSLAGWNLTADPSTDAANALQQMSPAEQDKLNRRFMKTPAGRLLRFTQRKQGLAAAPVELDAVMKLYMDGFTEMATETIRVLQGGMEGSVTQQEVFDYLVDLLALLEISMEQCGNIVRYTHYLNRFRSIEMFMLLEELDRAETALVDQLLQSNAGPQDAAYVQLDRRFGFLQDMVTAELRHAQLVAIEKQYRYLQPAALIAALQQLVGDDPAIAAFASAQVDYLSHLKTATEYYQLAKTRAGVIGNRTIDRMRDGGYDRAILLTGGLHQSQIEGVLASRNVSYQVIMPATVHQADGESWVESAKEKQS